MFQKTTAFNQDISGWDVSSGTKFVSGMGQWESLSSCYFWILSSACCLFFCCPCLAVLEGILYCSCIFYNIIMLIINIKPKFSHHSSLCPISSLLPPSSSTIRHYSSCFRRVTCFGKRRLSTNTFLVGILIAEPIL